MKDSSPSPACTVMPARVSGAAGLWGMSGKSVAEQLSAAGLLWPSLSPHISFSASNTKGSGISCFSSWGESGYQRDGMSTHRPLLGDPAHARTLCPPVHKPTCTWEATFLGGVGPKWTLSSFLRGCSHQLPPKSQLSESHRRPHTLAIFMVSPFRLPAPPPLGAGPPWCMLGRPSAPQKRRAPRVWGRSRRSAAGLPVGNWKWCECGRWGGCGFCRAFEQSRPNRKLLLGEQRLLWWSPKAPLTRRRALVLLIS